MNSARLALWDKKQLVCRSDASVTLCACMKMLPLLVLLLPLSVFADAVSYDQFLSKDLLKGGVPCSALGSDFYLNEPATAFAEPTMESIFPEKKTVQIACVAGGGDCDCYVMFTDKVPSSQAGKAFYRGRLDDQSSAWFLAYTDSEKSIEILATQAKDAEITLRKPAPAIFLNGDASKKISADRLFHIPKNIANKVRASHSDRYVLATLTSIEVVKGRKIANLAVALVANNPDDQQWDEAAFRKRSEQRFKLRDVSIPFFDEAGRINFWMYLPPGC